MSIKIVTRALLFGWLTVSVLFLVLGPVTAQDVQPRAFDPNYDDPEVRALNKLIAPQEGEDPATTFARYKSELSDERLFSQIIALLKRNANRPLEDNPYQDSVLEAIKVLGFTGRDQAVDAIAPYLKQPTPSVQTRVADSLRITQNPRAVPPLKTALVDVESRLPTALVANPDTEASLTTLGAYFRSLSMIRSDDALAALDASLNRLRSRYGASEVGVELLRQLQHVRETGGIQEYRRSAASPVPVEQPPSLPVAAPAPAVPTATPMPSSPISTSAESPAPLAEHQAPVWPWVAGILALAVVALLVWKAACS